MEKVLTIAIAAYNVGSTLRQTLDSLEQSLALDALDILVVDDGSADDTAGIAAEYVTRRPGSFRLHQKENGGWGSTVNAGITLASGRYFMQLDGDDYLENVSFLVDYLKDCDTDLVYLPYAAFNHADGKQMRLWSEGEQYPQRTALPFREAPVMPSIHSMAVKTGLLRKAGISLTEKCFYTDLEFIIKTIVHVQTVSYFDEVVYEYRRAYSGQSMSRAGVRAHYKEHQTVLAVLLDDLQLHAPQPFLRELVMERMACACYYQYLFYLALQGTPAQKRELAAYDAMLRNKNAELYERTGGHLISLMRRSRFFGYRPIAHGKTILDRILKKNLFQENS